jgi:hypothetical protein
LGGIFDDHHAGDGINPINWSKYANTKVVAVFIFGVIPEGAVMPSG